VRYGANRKDMIIKEEDRRRTAWHEAGHAVAKLILFPESKLDYLSIVPNESGALGFAAWQHDESKHTHSAEDYRHLIMVALAGREAEKLCPEAGPDAINTGASSDYETATALAWDAVTRFGFDETVGPMSLQGIPAHLHAELVSSLRGRADLILSQCLNSTMQLMEDSEQKVQKIAESLLKKQSLSGNEVTNLMLNL
jgi:ATP-dependent Zn protease